MNKKNIKIVGHRGGSSNKLENSIDAFRHGFSNGIDTAECDLNISKDGFIFIHHDPYIEINGEKKYTKDLLFEELLLHKPDICSLDDLLNNFANESFIFELKAGSDYKKIIDIFFEKHAAEFVKNKFISFSIDVLKYIKSKNQNIYCSYIGTSKGEDKRKEFFIRQKHIDLCVTNNIEELSGHWLTFLPNMIKKAHNKGIQVGIGPVNSKIVYKYCEYNNVDSVYTDNSPEISKLKSERSI